MKTLKSIFIVTLIFLVSCDKSINPLEDSNGWVVQREKQDDITYYSIHFSDKNNGWICGYKGTIKSSTDGGNTWQQQQSGVSENLWDISFVSSLKGWICGANSTILKTTDGGKSWKNVSPLNSQSKVYVSIKFVDENNGWTCNNNGEILQTTDGGLSWKLKKSGLVGGSRLSVINSQTVYALSENLYKTSNAGEAWDSKDVYIPKNYMAANMFFLNSSDGWVITENGTGGTIITEFPVIITNNGGETWSSSEFLKDGGLRCIYFINETVGWIAGLQNVYKTTDGGMNWKLEFNSENYNLHAKDMCFVNENCGWIINYSGVIYKYKN